jgi:prevent-host-death family protein
VAVEAGIRELRENLRAYLDRVKSGEEVVVTEHGRPVARIVAPGETTLERLIREGRVTPPRRPKTPIRVEDLARPRGSITDFYLEQKRLGKL